MEKIKMNVSEGLCVELTPNKEFEFVMPTSDVANGYGVSPYAIRKALQRHREELVKDKHFVVAGTFCPCEKNTPHNAVFFTKRGIVRLGFFIKSEQAKLFRDWAEDLVIASMDFADKVKGSGILPEAPKRKHNRLTSERMIDIMTDVAKIEDKELRLSIVNKLMK